MPNALFLVFTGTPYPIAAATSPALRVTTWLAEGKNPVHVKEALGHADLATTMGCTL